MTYKQLINLPVMGVKRVLSGIGSLLPGKTAKRTVTAADYGNFGVHLNAAGVTVSEETVKKLWIVYRCVDYLGKMMASLPFITYENLGEGAKKRASEHSVYTLLKTKPNKYMTPWVFKYLIMHHILITGNFYSEIEWSRAGYPVALWPLNPNATKVIEINGKIKYQTTIKSETITLNPERVIHIKNGTENGFMGRSVISSGVESFAVEIAAKEYGSSFFSHGAAPMGTLSTPQKLDDDVIKKMKAQWSDNYGGLSNSHRTAILEQGLTWSTVGISPQDAQMIETMKKSELEISSMFGVPPHKVNLLDNATFSNIEHQGIEFVTDTMRPHAVNIEEEFTRKLFLTSEKDFFIEILLDALMRGDLSARYTAYQSGINSGFLVIDEVRGWENLNPLPNDAGKVVFRPLNNQAIPLTDSAKKTIQPVNPNLDNQLKSNDRDCDPIQERRRANERRELSKTHQETMEAAANTIIKREIRELKKKLKPELTRDQAKSVIKDFYNDIWDQVRKIYATPTRSYLDSVRVVVKSQYGMDDQFNQYGAFVESYIDSLTSRHTQRSQGQLTGIVSNPEQDEYLDEINTRFDEWIDKRGDKIGKEEATRQLNAGTRRGLVLAGFLSFVWIADSDPCPMCREMDGSKAGIGGSFVEKGQNVGTEDVNMTVKEDIGHGPLHGGCECTIGPGNI